MADVGQVTWRLDVVAERLRRAARQDPSFASVAIDTETNTVTVYRVGGARGQAAAALAGVPLDGAKLQVRQAKLTKAQVDQLTKRILADLKALDRQGITIIKFGGDDGGGPYHIGVQGADQHRAFLQARYGQYGPGTVEIVEQQPLIPFSRAQAR